MGRRDEVQRGLPVVDLLCAVTTGPARRLPWARSSPFARGAWPRISRVYITWVGKMRDSEEIIRQIEAAFAGVAYPGREALFNDHCCECADVSASYAGRRWTEIALADVLAGRETSLLSPAAWRYYLPALMIWSIREPEAVDVIQDNLVYQLEPPDDTRGVPEWFHERAWGFSREQRLAIVAYLDWYRERDEALWEGTAPPRHVYNALAYWAADVPDASE